MRRIGEYQRVINKSKQESFLILAHCTPCSKREAIKIVKWFSKKYYHDDNFILIQFKHKCGFGGWTLYRKEKRPYIQLPSDRMYSPKQWYGKLRVGIVLHELAHAISDYSKRTRGNHGKWFMKIFDEILEIYYTKIENR